MEEHREFLLALIDEQPDLTLDAMVCAMQGHWKTITFVAALRRHGMRRSQTIVGSTTGKKFLPYVAISIAF